MGDLKNPKVIYLKGFLFLVAGTAAAGLLISKDPSLETVALVGITIWSFCRLYYFMFYVVEKYVDPSYKFSGIIPFIAYLVKQNRDAGTK